MTTDQLNPHVNKLLYQRVADFILQKINEGIYQPGELIPPERELCKSLEVSRYTVRKAIQQLVQAGFLYRVQGNGTFVFDKKEIYHKKSDFVGVSLPSCDTEMEMKLLNGIQRGLQDVQYKMTFIDSRDDYKTEAENIQFLKNEGVAGLIIMPAEDQKDSTAISDLKEEAFPFVLIDRRLQDCETDCIMSDNIDGGYKATEYLIKLGHEKIAFIKHESNKTSSVEDRIIGYQKAMAEYGLEYNRVFSFNRIHHQGKEILQVYHFLKEHKPTAVVAVNDYIALDIVKMCREKGILLPRELSLVSFDNLDVVKHLEVPLTSIAQQSKKIGQRAARLLLDKIRLKEEGDYGEFQVSQQLYYPTELIERDSCLPLD